MFKKWLIGFSVVAVSLFVVSTAFARDWNVGDSDLPADLRGLNQAQLDIINKTNELNPAENSFNPALLAMFLQTVQTPPTVRTGDSTTALPPVNTQTANDIGGAPTGIGLGPSPTDGPVNHVTTTHNPNAETSGETGDGTAMGIFFGELFLGPDEFWDMVSGSGGSFGDCIGADCIPHIGRPGYPLGGPPHGSWVHHDRSLGSFRFANDSSVLDAVRNRDFAEGERLIQTQVGQDVRHDPRGRGF